MVLFVLSGSAASAPQTKFFPMESMAACQAARDALYKNPPPAAQIATFQAGCLEARDEAKGV